MNENIKQMRLQGLVSFFQGSKINVNTASFYDIDEKDGDMSPFFRLVFSIRKVDLICTTTFKDGPFGVLYDELLDMYKKKGQDNKQSQLSAARTMHDFFTACASAQKKGKHPFSTKVEQLKRKK